MRVFCDTNILLEFLLERQDAKTVEDALRIIHGYNGELFISTGGFYTITYITEQFLRKHSGLPVEERTTELRKILNSILREFSIAPHTLSTLGTAVADDTFKDLEDSYQAQAAINSQCDILLTINHKHFTGLSNRKGIRVLAPAEFVTSYT